MHSHSQHFQLQNISEFRSILQEISLENEHSIKYQLTQYLEDQNLSIQKITTVCMSELTKKEQYLTNVVEFSLHILNELQTKNDSLTRTCDQLTKLHVDFDKLLAHNQQLVKKIEFIEDENYQFKNKIEQAETYLSQVSQTESLKTSVESLPPIQVHTIQISNFSKNYSHLTERPSLTTQNSISSEQFNTKINKYEQNLHEKTMWITQLEQEVKELTQRILALENQLSIKSSQLELSELYFKEKLDIIASSQAINRSHQVSISEIQLNSVFRKDLLRVDSAKSIESIVQSQSSQNSQKNQDKSHYFQVDELYCQRTNKVRRSLMQDFVTDFGLQSNQSMYSSILDQQTMSPDNSCILRGRKKSISVSTADMRKTSSKGVQTSFDPVTKIIRRTTSNQNARKIQEEKDKHQSSFLGLGSITSMFSKKNILNENNICQAIQRQTIHKNDTSILGDSSIGDIFKGIFDYATKKIVTNRIHKKSKVNLNQSFTQQLNKTQKKSYVKGMKY